jgi:hypothetical protein
MRDRAGAPREHLPLITMRSDATTSEPGIRRRTRRRAVVLASLLVLVAAACDDAGGATGQTSGTLPPTVASSPAVVAITTTTLSPAQLRADYQRLADAYLAERDGAAKAALCAHVADSGDAQAYKDVVDAFVAAGMTRVRADGITAALRHRLTCP